MVRRSPDRLSGSEDSLRLRRGSRPPRVWLLPAFFALAHGRAHGTEMPVTVGGLEYGIGFLTGTAFLYLVGIALGIATGRFMRDGTLRWVGATFMAVGIAIGVSG